MLGNIEVELKTLGRYIDKRLSMIRVVSREKLSWQHVRLYMMCLQKYQDTHIMHTYLLKNTYNEDC